MDMNKEFQALKDFLFSKYEEHDCTGFNLSDFIYAFGKASEALLFSALFMPELTIIEDSVLLKDRIENKEDLLEFLEAKKKESCLAKVEAAFNFIEVGYLFNARGRNTSDGEDELLAQRLRDAWDGWLKICFPDRCFVVKVLRPEETGSTIGVHFFQKR